MTQRITKKDAERISKAVKDERKASLVEQRVSCPDCGEARQLLGLALYMVNQRLINVTNKEYDEAFDKIRAYLKRVGFIEEGN